MSVTIAPFPLDSLATLPLLRGMPFQSSAGWWRAVCQAALPDQAQPQFLLASATAASNSGPSQTRPSQTRPSQTGPSQTGPSQTSPSQTGEPAFLLPLLKHGARLSALTTPYTCLYQPPATPHAPFEAIGHALAPRLGPLLRIDAIDPAWPGWPPLLAGLKQAGRHAMPFAGFGRWHEPIAGRNWRAYLADRPGTLRETIRRRLGRAERDPAITIEIATDLPAALPLLDQYESVYGRSWKPPEPYPRFAAAFVREAAAAGVLRIAVLRRDELPLAAQYWTVDQGTATILKLAHDKDARSLSPGTVLTAWMIRRLIEEDGVTALDFGRGDDPYKQLWATQRQQRDGLIIANPLHPVGALALLRQAAGQVTKRFRSPAAPDTDRAEANV